MAYFLTIRDRRLIEEAVNKGMSIQAVARLIGKTPMAVDRELMLKEQPELIRKIEEGRYEICLIRKKSVS